MVAAVLSSAKEFGSDIDVERLTGRKRKTLQKDRSMGGGPFPFYRVGRKVVYDLEEVRTLILKGRVESPGSNAAESIAPDHPGAAA